MSTCSDVRLQDLGRCGTDANTSDARLTASHAQPLGPWTMPALASKKHKHITKVTFAGDHPAKLQTSQPLTALNQPRERQAI
tara:strand:- start:324 stop:569 length:246 start_codon:yes stop_codon:yes gene_type:complete